MTSPKVSELNNAILLYLCQCQTSGDTQSLEKLGINKEVRQILEELTVQEILHLSKIPTSFAQIKIDNGLLSNLFMHVRRESTNRATINKLVELGAPLKLMKELTGTNAMEFSALRKLLNVSSLGRTQDPTPEEEMLIFTEWKQFDMRQMLGKDEWIEFSLTTGLPIKTIHKVICEDESTGYGKTN